ncbi:M48 family metallopeptidase [Desulfovibrio mangrovi]|uniref:M48 family metallopeptidase n=1 Tax=Desulfovibrio mangrovi TaxID=2976983 RepID=UPI002247358D|nr:M48 family metallopeptidase [Desulfovibrio mangrovi]UZP66372.1 M48 family metallopeptidase [Desulfovibrio mangrovi]
MNICLVLVLVFLLLAWGLEVVSSLLTIRRLDSDEAALPAEFRDVADEASYARSQAYTRANVRFDMVTETLGTVLLVIAIFIGAFNWLDVAAMKVTEHPILQGLVFFGLLALVNSAVSMPAAVYRTFVLEERFGFNRTTPALFIRDRIKGAFLAVCIGGPLLAGVLWFFAVLGDWAWLTAWLFTVAVMLLVQYVAPVLILPMFNKFTPLPEGSLRSAIEAYVRSAGFALSGLFVMDGSKRSGKGNAFFTGFGRKKRIALFDTLIDSMTEEEVVGVVAHEVGHCKLRHVHRMMFSGIIQTGVTFLLLSFVLGYGPMFDAFGMERMSTHAGIVFFGFLYAPVSLIMGLWANMRSRAYEFEADAFAAESTKKAEALASALKRLSLSNLSNLTPHPFAVFLHYSHPPVVERIRHLARMESGRRD